MYLEKVCTPVHPNVNLSTFHQERFTRLQCWPDHWEQFSVLPKDTSTSGHEELGTEPTLPPYILQQESAAEYLSLVLLENVTEEKYIQQRGGRTRKRQATV